MGVNNIVAENTIIELIKDCLIPEQACIYKETPQNQKLTPAAVLIGLIETINPATGENELQILLTKRTAHLHHHPGQISFPGGRKDKVDHNPMQTALRETAEETGITETFIDVLGTLDEYLTVTGFRVMPIVASIKQGFSLKPDAFEVEDIFFVPLKFILNKDNHKRYEYSELNPPGAEANRASFYYQIDYENWRIWGVTAAILVSFYKRLNDNHPLFCELMLQMEKQGLRNHKK